ncbi:MAG: arabinogalactan endo-1,4-beta-galactosidase [Chitinophagaceae bacterium]|nr:arabinogalactan endo-1,4-beta-galactosidase [Chitinophagaceae bacterium]
MKGIQKISFGIWSAFLILISQSDCRKSGNLSSANETGFYFAKGADVSWITEMEASGISFYNPNGVREDCFMILKNLGFNAIRLRVWVNPAEPWNRTPDVIQKAIRAKNAGMKLMIDFHYSDTWADPGKQFKPAAWSSLSFPALREALYQHTVDVLTSLKSNGITPDWVQIGNETNDGMLWPEGRASLHMNQFAALINRGYDAVKAVDSTIKVIVHLSNGYDNALYRWIFDGLKNNGARWDIIGMSLYPEPNDWQTLNRQCLDNINDMIIRYNKPVMICEVGMSWDRPVECKSFLTDLIQKLKSVPGRYGLGVFYWEPQCHNNWKGYTKGAFDNSGKPTKALEAFKN